MYSTSSQNTPRRRLPAFVDEFNKSFVFVSHWREICFVHCWIFHIEMQADGPSVSQQHGGRLVGIEFKGRDKVFQRHLVTTNTDVVCTYAELHVTQYLRKLGRMCMQ